MNTGLNNNENILFEGAQGAFLDITYGTYPYVTSSHPLAGNVFNDVGIGPRDLNVIGITKAYTTRVGKGPFLSELHNDLGDEIREKGKEYGTTTGRPRRCGWLDLVMLKYSIRLNGVNSLVITKLDILSGLDTIKVATGYRLRNKTVNFPLTINQLEKCKVEYKEFKGFSVKQNTKTFKMLDPNAVKYLKFIERFTSTPISLISIGPERNQTLTF